MKKITFTCETVTPLFLAGADGTTPELRAPSIKGALRFWWRAINGHLSLDELRKREGEIFGGIGEKQGRSKIIIQLYNKNLEPSDNKLVPHKSFKAKKAFKSHQEFTIRLCLSEDKDKSFSLEQLKALFILICILGGLGRRSRRGMGSIRIKKIDDKLFQCSTLSDISKYLNQINPDKFKLENGLIRSNFGRNEHYPYIKQIQLGNKPNCDYLMKVSETTRDNHRKPKYEPSLGYAGNNGRFASPIYVSLIEVDEELRPIITTLNAVSDKGSPDPNLQEEFRNNILL